VAHQHARVLEDPAPIASFEGFGDNTLNLMLRCYMPNLDGRIGVVTELHSEVDAAFGEAGILERARGRRLQDSVRNATE
jgi:potassium efflux system protein